ncbi:uncharacterized protein (DUF983 family) [Rhodoligotrophos appendicifer]|uniref:DUF983 domain-containing protein n=1 Tax=Rhodoligotrophos appendicifer TaxID=987056 RepID=UPI001FEB5D04|nr:DUF983 domain-containing protein [Rhodoligotrophos appendicifer]
MTASRPRDLGISMLRGSLLCCPACGARSLFGRYLKVADSCSACGEELHHHQADDAPPYFTIFIVGHILVPLVLVVEQIWSPPLAIQTPIWLFLTLALTLTLLPMVKGAVVGLQWALLMHGFETASKAPLGIPSKALRTDDPAVAPLST